MYRPGATNPSHLSRHPIPIHPGVNKCTKPNLADEHVRFVAQNAVPIAISIEHLRTATKQDPTLQALTEMLQNNTWHSLATKYCNNSEIDLAKLRAFAKIQQELSLTAEVDNEFPQGNRLVVPRSLHKRVVQLAHEGHQGLIKLPKQ